MSDPGRDPISEFLDSCGGMTIGADPPEPSPTIPGLPFAHPGVSLRWSGPTGSGKSQVLQTGLFDAGLAGYTTLYAGFEVSKAEFDARATIIDHARGRLTPEQRTRLSAHVTYAEGFALFDLIARYPAAWRTAICGRFHIVVIDPAGDACAALGLNDEDNGDWAKFNAGVLAPIRGHTTTVILDNVGHAEDAKRRSRGASQKENGADIVLYSKAQADPAALIIAASKVRSVTAPFQKGDQWIAYRDGGQPAALRERDDSAPGPFEPTGVMERISLALEAAPGLSVTAVRAAVGGKAATASYALELLVAHGHVRAEKVGTALQHTVAKPYREADRVPVSRPCPAVSQDTAQDRVPVSPTLGGDTGHDPQSALVRICDSLVTDRADSWAYTGPGSE